MDLDSLNHRHFPAVIIGAGQAGLAAGHELARRGFTPGTDFIIVDANDGPGGAWRHRWDSLTLGKAHGIADLPGMPMQRPDPDVPASQLVAEYYGAYEREFAFNVVRPAQVTSVAPEGDQLAITVAGGAGRRDEKKATPTNVVIGADAVLSATGTWANPHIPFVPGIGEFKGRQLHTKGYTRKGDFAGLRTLVVGGGLSAVQFLLELAQVTDTVWATRRPPNFTAREFGTNWGLAVEDAVRERTFHGQAPASVVRTTGIPQRPEYLQGVADGTLVSRGMFDRITRTGVVFGEPFSDTADGLGPSSHAKLQVPESWNPYPAGTSIDVDVIFWNTGFRHALRHLAPMKLREPGGGILMRDEVSVRKDPRVFLVGYGSTASTVGATRAGRQAGRAAAAYLRGEISGQKR
ncbi:FAD-dependent oxidoreductase [Corynebacterium auriscanis]|uniref:FAD-dependent oxidoreductase n=1 Tax=Corynebacterium auriscanis TaxID=99807 RepID=UPI002245682C|nr:FAD-dependent oxidoreductase [Corynebacterium auriscanis]MCX2163844.1 NAD(P)/FAD-dependent oxidoreductase [Corynebacterium auriscanis]